MTISLSSSSIWTAAVLTMMSASLPRSRIRIRFLHATGPSKLTHIFDVTKWLLKTCGLNFWHWLIESTTFLFNVNKNGIGSSLGDNLSGPETIGTPDYGGLCGTSNHIIRAITQWVGVYYWHAYNWFKLTKSFLLSLMADVWQAHSNLEDVCYQVPKILLLYRSCKLGRCLTMTKMRH